MGERGVEKRKNVKEKGGEPNDPHTPLAPHCGRSAPRQRASSRFPRYPCRTKHSGGKGIEAVAIGVYRQRYGASPTCNFRRLPPGYVGSSGNSARFGRRREAVPGEVEAATRTPRHLRRRSRQRLARRPLLPWVGRDISGVNGCRWTIGHSPTKSRACTAFADYSREGLSISVKDAYVPTPYALSTATRPAHVPSRQALAFARGERARRTRTTPAATSHQRLELETDLIAAHIVCLGAVPQAQYVG